jgi:putative heme iron utilization protein
MPYRVVAPLKLALFGSGYVGCSWVFVAMEADHLKAMILAVGSGCLLLAYWAAKDLTPAIIAALRQYHQYHLDMDEMDRRASVREAEHEAELRAIAGRVEEVESDAAEKRHSLRTDVNAKLVAAYAEIAELKARLDGTHAAAINTLADDVHTLADNQSPPVPVQASHLDPPEPPRP